MTYEEAVKGWAIQRFSLDPNAVMAVDVDYRRGTGGGCDTCDYGADYGGIEVEIKVLDPSTRSGYRYITHDMGEDFGTVIREIVEFSSH